MSAIQPKGFQEFSKALQDIADNWDSKVTDGLFEYVGQLAVSEMKSIAPVDTGTLRDGIKMTKSSAHTVTIVSTAPYSAAVDKGHSTGDGTDFVPANPFFSSVIGRIAGGDLIQQARIKADSHITATLSHYRVRA